MICPRSPHARASLTAIAAFAAPNFNCLEDFSVGFNAESDKQLVWSTVEIDGMRFLAVPCETLLLLKKQLARNGADRGLSRPDTH